MLFRNSFHGGQWKAKGFGQKKFLIKFLSFEKLDEMCDYNFGLKGSAVTIRISNMSDDLGAVFKLSTVWVQVFGVPEPFHHRDGFAEVATLIGTFLDADMKGFWENEIVRIKCGVKDPSKIPGIAEFTDKGTSLVYHIGFELEKVEEEGGHLIDGHLITISDFNRELQRNSEGRDLMRAKNMQNERAETQVLNSGNGKTGTHLKQISEDVDCVVSSQASLDRRMEEELREKMLLQKSLDERKHGNKGELEKLDFEQNNVDSDMQEADKMQEERGDSLWSAEQVEGVGENVSLSQGLEGMEDMDADTYARKLGYNTQEMQKFGEELGSENSDNDICAGARTAGEVLQKKSEPVEAKKVKRGTKSKDNFVEERKPSNRTDTEQNMMDRAMERTRLKNLDGHQETRTTRDAGQRGKASAAGGS